MTATREILQRFVPSALVALLSVPLLYVVSRSNYLLFHSLIETVGLVVAFGIFAVAWNTRRIGGNGYLLFVGQAFLFVAAIDLLHMLAYKGMGVFPGHGANLPTQLWIAARALETAALLLAPAFLTRPVPLAGAMLGTAALAAGLTAAVFTEGWFPDCFVEGRGLTAFKVGAEAVIVAGLLGALALLARRRARLEAGVYGAVAGALLLKVAAELSFTLYSDVYGLSNLLGHLLRLLALILVYQALVETGISRPFHLLFRDLKRGEESLQAENRELTAIREALERKNAEYAALIVEKNELLGVAAHDIRSPLAVIEMYGALLARSSAARADAKEAKLVAMIRRNSHRALQMVTDVLDLAAIESGKLRLEMRPQELQPLVAEVLEPHRALALGKGIEIALEPPESPLPPVALDPLRFEQVLSNLLSNAVKFSQPGARVTVRLLERGSAAGFSVQDQGCGIAPDDLHRIFLPFSRAASQAPSGEKSTGLGLAIVHKIVTAHGGCVEVESAIGRGSTFTVLFPLTAAPHCRDPLLA